jgi:hypothetical protein
MYRTCRAWAFCRHVQEHSAALFFSCAGCLSLCSHLFNIQLRWMFISDIIRDGILKLHQVPTTQQVADIGTKALPWPFFCALLYIVFGLA